MELEWLRIGAEECVDVDSINHPLVHLVVKPGDEEKSILLERLSLRSFVHVSNGEEAKSGELLHLGISRPFPLPGRWKTIGTMDHELMEQIFCSFSIPCASFKLSDAGTHVAECEDQRLIAIRGCEIYVLDSRLRDFLLDPETNLVSPLKRKVTRDNSLASRYSDQSITLVNWRHKANAVVLETPSSQLSVPLSTSNSPADTLKSNNKDALKRLIQLSLRNVGIGNRSPEFESTYKHLYAACLFALRQELAHVVISQDEMLRVIRNSMEHLNITGLSSSSQQRYSCVSTGNKRKL